MCLCTNEYQTFIILLDRYIADLFVYTFLITIVKHSMISFTFDVTSISTTRQNVAVRLCPMLVIFPLFIHFLSIDGS